jgi:hypothetical protein
MKWILGFGGTMMALALAGCAVPTDGTGSAGAQGAEGAPASTTEALTVRRPGAELKLTASLVRVTHQYTQPDDFQRQYLSFSVENVGTTSAVPSAVVVTCSRASDSLGQYGYVYPFCLNEDQYIGVPALAPGAKFSYLYPQQGVQIGFVSVPLSGQEFSFSETFNVRVVSPQFADPWIGTTTLTDGCENWAACASEPAPSSYPGGPGVLATPYVNIITSQTGYILTHPTPTSIKLESSLDTTASPHAFSTVTASVSLTAPAAGGSPNVSGAAVDVYYDGAFVGNSAQTSGMVSFQVGPADSNAHTLMARFNGNSVYGPSFSRTIPIQIVP